MISDIAILDDSADSGGVTGKRHRAMRRGSKSPIFARRRLAVVIFSTLALVGLGVTTVSAGETTYKNGDGIKNATYSSSGGSYKGGSSYTASLEPIYTSRIETAWNRPGYPGVTAGYSATGAYTVTLSHATRSNSWSRCRYTAGPVYAVGLTCKSVS